MHGWSGARFFHQQAGGGCDLVGDRDDGVMQFAAAEVIGAAQIEHRIHAGDAEANFGQSIAPRTAEGVGDEDGDRCRRGAGESRREGGAPTHRHLRAAGWRGRRRGCWIRRRRHWRRPIRGRSRRSARRDHCARFGWFVAARVRPRADLFPIAWHTPWRNRTARNPSSSPCAPRPSRLPSGKRRECRRLASVKPVWSSPSRSARRGRRPP